MIIMENSDLTICNTNYHQKRYSCDRRRGRSSICNKLVSGSGLEQLSTLSSTFMDASYSKLIMSSTYEKDQIRRQPRRQLHKRTQEQHHIHPICAIEYNTDSQSLKRRSTSSQINTDAISILNNVRNEHNNDPSRTNVRKEQNLLTDLKKRLIFKSIGKRQLAPTPTFMVMNIVAAAALILCMSILIFQSQLVVSDSIPYATSNSNNNDQAQQQSASSRSSDNLKQSMMNERSDSSSGTSDSASGVNSIAPSSSSTANSIVASLSSAVASAAVATAVAAAQNHLAGGDARSLSSSAKKNHHHTLAQQTGRSQGLNLALKIADSIPEVPYNILHNMKKVEHAAPFYDVPNKLTGPTSKVKESTASGLFNKAFATASGGTGSGSGGLSGAAEQLGYIFRSPIWKRIANSYGDFTSELKTRLKLNSPATPMKGSTGVTSSTTSKLIRDVSVPALLMLLASAIPTEWRPTRTRRKSSSSLPSSSQAIPLGDSYLTPAESVIPNMIRPSFVAPMQYSTPEISSIYKSGSGPKFDHQQLFSLSNGNNVLQQQLQARSADDINLQAQQQQPQIGVAENQVTSGNWLNDRSQMLAVHSTNDAGGHYEHQHHQVPARYSNSLGQDQQMQPMSSMRRTGEAYSTHATSNMQQNLVSMKSDNAVVVEPTAQANSGSSLTSGVQASEEYATPPDASGQFNGAKLISLDANLRPVDLMSNNAADDKNLISNPMLQLQMIGNAQQHETVLRRSSEIQLPSSMHGYTLIGENEPMNSEKKRSILIPITALAHSLSSKLTQPVDSTNLQARHGVHSNGATMAERRQLSSNGIGPNGMILSEQRDLSLLLPQAWKDVVKRTVSNVQQQATSQWKTIEGQLTNWVQDKLKAFPIPSSSGSTGSSNAAASAPAPITLTSSGSGGPAPVANLIASVSSTAMNILGLGNRSQSSASPGTATNNSVVESSSPALSTSSSSSATTSKGKPANNSPVSRAQQSVEAALSGVANMIVGTLTNSRQQISQSSSSSSIPSSSSSFSSSSSTSADTTLPKTTITNQRNHEYSLSSAAHPVTSVASQYPTVTVSSSSTTTTATLPQPSSTLATTSAD